MEVILQCSHGYQHRRPGLKAAPASPGQLTSVLSELLALLLLSEAGHQSGWSKSVPPSPCWQVSQSVPAREWHLHREDYRLWRPRVTDGGCLTQRPG